MMIIVDDNTLDWRTWSGLEQTTELQMKGSLVRGEDEMIKSQIGGRGIVLTSWRRKKKGK